MNSCSFLMISFNCFGSLEFSWLIFRYASSNLRFILVLKSLFLVGAGSPGPFQGSYEIIFENCDKFREKNAGILQNLSFPVAASAGLFTFFSYAMVVLPY